MDKLAHQLSGTWQNQLGSRAAIDFHPNGALSGEYRTAVGNATIGVINGSFIVADNGNVAVGFVVAWKPSKDSSKQPSVTSWSERSPESKRVQLQDGYHLDLDPTRKGGLGEHPHQQGHLRPDASRYRG
jgi:hypothetical protein